jgi:hypothetical protein
MKVAVASKSCHWELWAALRSAGVPLISTWPDWPYNRDDTRPAADDEWCDHAQKCLQEAAEADILILYCKADERQFGSLLECGAALGAGKRVFLISPFEWSFLRCHPRVRTFKNLEEAITAVMAGAAGELARKEKGAI